MPAFAAAMNSLFDSHSSPKVDLETIEQRHPRPRQIEALGTLIFLRASLAAPFIDAATVLVPLFVVAGLGLVVGRQPRKTLQVRAAPPGAGPRAVGQFAESIGLRVTLGVAAGRLLMAILISCLLR